MRKSHPAMRSPKDIQNAVKRNNFLRKALQITIPVLIISIIVTTAFIIIEPHLQANTLSFSDKVVYPVFNSPDGELIGISDGSYSFDKTRGDAHLKDQAAAKFSSGNVSGAAKFWENAAAFDSSDAEPLIYRENLRVLTFLPPRHYFTLVVGTILSGKFAGVGRDSLQGAYIAQKEYNDRCLRLPDCLPARLLIANAGSGQTASDEVAYASMIAQKIVYTRQQLDQTIVGVMGWSASSQLAHASTIFTAAHLPVISPAALLSGSSQSPYIFSVAPPIARQGTIGAYYAEHFLNAHSAVVFVDPVDHYSQSLADAFVQQFTDDKNTVIATKTYKVGVAASVQSDLQAIVGTPDLLYFAGHSTDIGTLLSNLPPCGPSSCLQVLGGDGLYELNGYPFNVDQLNRLHFTSFAYPDEWGIFAQSAKSPDFFTEYPQAFNPDNMNHSSNPYGFTRADNDAILSYDALDTLLITASHIFANQNASFSDTDLQTLQQNLAQIKGPQSLQGVSGEISFDVDGNPVDKVVLVLHFNPQNDIQEDQCFGSFLKPELNITTTPGCLNF